jgi:flagellin-like protein
MNSKAISPMIATILLIAFTVAVGGIISVWMTGYTRTVGQSVSSATENTTACIGTYPNVISVTSNAILVMNPGSENITGLICYASNGTALTPETTILVPGNITSISWTRTGSSIVCTASCRNNTGVSGECKSGQSCWT